MLHHYFDQIYCINLDRRPDRWESCLRIFAKHGIENVTRFPATDSKKMTLPFDSMYCSELACTLSHLKVIETAIENSTKRLLILEDDVVFHEKFNILFESYWHQVPANWDVILMGGTHIEQPQSVSANILKINRTYALHAYAIHPKAIHVVQQHLATAAQRIFQEFEKSTLSAAPDYLVADLQKQLNFYSFSPPLAWQQEGYSDLQNAIVSYDFLKPSKPEKSSEFSIQEITEKRFEIANLNNLDLQLEKLPGFQDWRTKPHAICYYGSVPYAATVRLTGLAQAAQRWNVPFIFLVHGQEESINQIIQSYTNILLIVSNPERLGYVEALFRRPGCKLVIFGRYIDEAPSTDLYVASMCEAEKIALNQYARDIDLAISELSLEGNARLLRSYVMSLGIPVMSFPWGVNLQRHTPVFARKERDLLFIGTFSEKSSRVFQYWTNPFQRFSHSLIGPDWTRSPFTNTYNSSLSTEDFNKLAPSLYSSSTISLNLHHGFEVDGFTCNERTFNSIACGGFLVSDHARRIRDFLSEDELLMFDNPAEYFDAIQYFIKYPERRYPYMRQALQTLYSQHTYHHRLADLLSVIFEGKPISEFCPVMDFVQF